MDDLSRAVVTAHNALREDLEVLAQGEQRDMNKARKRIRAKYANKRTLAWHKAYDAITYALHMDQRGDNLPT